MIKRQFNRAKSSTRSNSWDRAGHWYDKIVADQGHQFHQSLLIPKILGWLRTSGLVKNLLDLGCGQGVLARAVDPSLPYLGIDNSQALLSAAKRRKKSEKQQFTQADFSSDSLSFEGHLKRGSFSHAVMLLSLQNMANGLNALGNARSLLQSDGQLLIILNHPCFRIPRQSSWSLDQKQMTQSRCINAYLSPMEIPIVTNPGQSSNHPDRQHSVMSYHFSLALLTQWLRHSGFVIAEIDEWVSEKTSDGKFAKAENRARREIPLFLALHALCHKGP